MFSSTDQILRIYNTKPKVHRRGRKGANAPHKVKFPKQLRSVERVIEPTLLEKKRLRSLDRISLPSSESRHFSPLKINTDVMSFSGGMVDGMDRLQELMTKSNKARSSRLNVQIQMLNLGVTELVQGGKLASVTELDDFHVEDMEPLHRGDWNPAEALLNKYESQMDTRLKVLKADE